MANSALTSSAALAATGTPECVRGVAWSAAANSVTVDTDGKPVSVALTDKTAYLKVGEVETPTRSRKGSFIGTATKDVGGTQVALEVVIFPPSMRGTGEGHYARDKIPDSTLSGGAQTSSSMTNGNVKARCRLPVPDVKSSMTNGDVSCCESRKAESDISWSHMLVAKQDVLVLC